MLDTRLKAKAYYREILSEAEFEGLEPQVMADLGRRDLFFMLTVLLGRSDADTDWIYDRCREVQERPNGMLDLWAREHYKSTIITFAKTIQDILDSHSEESYYWEKEITVCIFSHTRPIAKAFLNQIMQEFETNELLKQLYPDVLYQNPTRESPKWSQDAGIVVKRKSNPKEATIEAHGLVDGQPTSKHFDILNYDDVVTAASVTTPEMMEKVVDMLALSYNLGAHGGVKRFIGTRYHTNDAYATVLRRETAQPRIYAATEDGTPEGKPVYLSREALAEKRKEMGPYIFGSQMMQNPKADDTQGFLEEWNKTYDRIKWEDMNRYILVDPASSKKKGSDYTAIMVIGLNVDGAYYLIDGIRDRMNLTERTGKVFEFHKKYKPLKTGYEQYAQQADKEHIEYEMDIRNYRFNITPLGGLTGKIDRIKKLVPSFEQRRFYMPGRLIFTDYEGKAKDLVAIIKEELNDFPVASHDDCIDCMARVLDPDIQAEFPELEEVGIFDKQNNIAEMEFNVFDC